MAAEQLTIKEAAKKYGYTEQYIRLLVRQGKVETSLVPRKLGSAVMRHAIHVDSLEEWLDTTTRKTARKDGRNKYVFYANPSEYEMAMVAWETYDPRTAALVPLVRTANPLKPKRKKVKHDK